MTTKLNTGTAERSAGAVPRIVREAGPGVAQLAAATRATGRRIATVASGDRRWSDLGPMVTALADAVRRALGSEPPQSSGEYPPVVRQRDLAVAGRRLLHPAATVVDRRAAATALRIADRIARSG